MYIHIFIYIYICIHKYIYTPLASSDTTHMNTQKHSPNTGLGLKGFTLNPNPLASSHTTHTHTSGWSPPVCIYLSPPSPPPFRSQVYNGLIPVLHSQNWLNTNRLP